MGDPRNIYTNVIFTLNAPEAQSVSIAGSFNNWDVNAHPLKRSRKWTGEYGDWEITVPLQPGLHEYLFSVDGQWWNDPSSEQYMANKFGTLNNVVEVDQLRLETSPDKHGELPVATSNASVAIIPNTGGVS
jgi:1,4-alpha-glucan branching enzyme